MHIYNITYTGFVYIWHDTTKNKFYIGSHYGDMSDGYVCSNTIMKRVFKKRPEKCKRRILQTTTGDIKNLHLLEQHWLDQIKDSELCGVKYYNIKKNARGGSAKGPKKNKPTSLNHKYRSPESNAKRSASLKGRQVNEITRHKMACAKLGIPNKHQSKQCSDGNVVYGSLTDMAKSLNLSIEGARQRIIKSHYPHSYC